MLNESPQQRLQRINWDALATVKDEAHADLARLFLARASEVARQFHVLYKEPFGAINQVPGVDRLVPPPDFSSVVPRSQPPLVRLSAGLYWGAALRAGDGDELAQQIIRVFEPLIQIFEQGGMIDMHRGYLVADGQWSLPLANWMTTDHIQFLPEGLR